MKAEYILFQVPAEHLPGYTKFSAIKQVFNNFKRIQVKQNTFSDIGMKVQMNKRKTFQKSQNIWELNKSILNNP